MEIFATIALIVGLALLFAAYFRRDSEYAAQETQDKFIELIRQDLHDDANNQEGRKKERRSVSVTALAKALAETKLLTSGEGLSFIKRLNHELTVAGIRDRYNPYEALAIALTIWAMGVIVPTLMVFAVGLPPWLYALVVAVFAYYPFAKIKYLQENRKDAIKMELPIFIQQLNMTLSSGMTTLDDAIKRVVKNAEIDPYDSQLAKEFGRAHLEYTLARQDRTTSLRGVYERTDVVGVHNLVEAIIQGLEKGSDMSKVLEEYSQLARELWKQDMRTFKAKKEPLITLGIVITMFGGFVLIATPMVINLMRAIKGF